MRYDRVIHQWFPILYTKGDERLIDQRLAERVLQAALTSGADFSELFMEDTVSNAIEMTDGKVENAAYTRRHGAGVLSLIHI